LTDQDVTTHRAKSTLTLNEAEARHKNVILCSLSRAGLPDFSLFNVPKRGKIFQMAIEYTNFFLSKALQNSPEFGVLV
jgi:hypothetical protein